MTKQFSVIIFLGFDSKTFAVAVEQALAIEDTV